MKRKHNNGPCVTSSSQRNYLNYSSFTLRRYLNFSLYSVGIRIIQRRYQNYTASVSELYSVGIGIIQRLYRNYTASVSKLYSVGIRIIQRRYQNYTVSVSELHSFGIGIIQRRYQNYTASVSEEGLTRNDFERSSRGASIAVTWHYLEGLRQTTTYLIRESRCVFRELNNPPCQHLSGSSPHIN